MRAMVIALLLSAPVFASSPKDSAIESGQAAASRDLIDPESARFREVDAYQMGEKWVVCGEVNAKNRFGGYVGFKRFYVSDGRPGLDDGNSYFPILFDALCADWLKARP